MQQLVGDMQTLAEEIHYDFVIGNVAKSLASLCIALLDEAKRLSKQQRIVAMHMFMLMISPESRSCKPYALPVQCLPICGLRDQQA